MDANVLLSLQRHILRPAPLSGNYDLHTSGFAIFEMVFRWFRGRGFLGAAERHETFYRCHETFYRCHDNHTPFRKNLFMQLKIIIQPESESRDFISL